MTVRVAIIDDSAFFREVLRELLGAAPDLEVVGEAGDGRRAVELVMELRPDVVTMDVLLPLVGGLDAIRAIMARRPTPIIVLSRLVGRGQQLGLDAIAAGALDVLEKPLAGLDGDHRRRLIELVRGAARAHLPPARPPPPRPPRALPVRGRPRAIGVVASTGGPQLVRAALAGLPASYPIPIVVVQHTVAGFAAPMASWFDTATPLAVAVAVDGRPLTAGEVAVAPDDEHVVVDRTGVLRRRAGPAEAGHRPSGTALLRSLAEAFGPGAMGVVLTGMGKDGADGLAAIAHGGGLAVVQDPADAAIDAMPRRALAAVPGATAVTAAELPALLRSVAHKGAR